jgi:hypothetical protein
MALTVTVYYIYRRAYVELAYFLITCTGFFLVTVLTYHLGDSDMAMERAYMPLGIFICIPFINEFIREYRKNDFLAFSFLLLILFISLAGITRTGSIYRERLAYLDKLLEQSTQLPGRKFLIEKQSTDMSKIIVPWAIGAETLLYSSLDSPDDSRTLYLVDDLEGFQFDRDDPNLYLCVPFWPNWDAASLNKSYFILQDGRYSPLILQ